MLHAVRNDSLDNFETNRDQDLGKAIADAAFALAHGGKKPDSFGQRKDIRKIHGDTTEQKQTQQRKS